MNSYMGIGDVDVGREKGEGGWRGKRGVARNGSLFAIRGRESKFHQQRDKPQSESHLSPFLLTLPPLQEGDEGRGIPGLNKCSDKGKGVQILTAEDKPFPTPRNPNFPSPPRRLYSGYSYLKPNLQL